MINVGDKVRVVGTRDGAVLTVAAVYLQGDPEIPWAACSFQKRAQHVHFKLSELELAK